MKGPPTSGKNEQQLEILLLSDRRPGHYHLAEGIIAAIERLSPVQCHRQFVHRRNWIPTRFLRKKFGHPKWPAKRILKWGYNIRASKLPPVDLVISAGGETQIANIAVTECLGVKNIFCGSLRNVSPENFSLIVTSYERFQSEPRYLVTLKPSTIDPDALGRPKDVPVYSADNPPRLAGLLIGGDSGLFHYGEDEWLRLLDFVSQVSEAWGTKWLISTSRRTDKRVGYAIQRLAQQPSIVEDYIDYNTAGPGTLSKIFSQSEVIVCTEDSSTMISEAISARLPVVGVAPEDHSFKSDEQFYRDMMLRNNWCRFVMIGGITVERFGQVLSEIKPMQANHLDQLAVSLKEKLPEIFRDAPRITVETP